MKIESYIIYDVIYGKRQPNLNWRAQEVEVKAKEIKSNNPDDIIS